MIYKNSDSRAIHAMEVARTGNYGRDYDAYDIDEEHSNCGKCNRYNRYLFKYRDQILCEDCLYDELYAEHEHEIEEI